MKEGISRRQALAWGLDVAFAGTFIYLDRKATGGILKGIFSHPPEQITPTVTEIQNYISVSKEGLMKNKVDVNTGAFASALCLLAVKEDPEKGLNKLRTFLWKYGLEIQIKEDDQTFQDQRGLLSFTGGRYHPLETGGPIIEYRPALFDYYELALEGGEAGTIKELDKSVIHEFVHLWQNIRNPIGEAIETEKFVVQNLVGEFKPELGYDYLKDPDEIEARDISEKIVDSFTSGKKNLIDLPWPFGKFFSFH